MDIHQICNQISFFKFDLGHNDGTGKIKTRWNEF